MNQELQDFNYFKDNQLLNINYVTSVITSKGKNNRIYYDIGSINPDGYVRLWCNKKLRMKHRLIYFLAHGELPNVGEEIDHYDNVRDNNKLSNLRILLKHENNTNSMNRKFGKQMTESKVRRICLLLAYTSHSDLTIANMVNISRGTVRDIKIRRSRIAIGNDYSWEHRIK